MTREWHFVYGGEKQGWTFTPLIGWSQASADEMDEWPQGSYRLVEWPQVIPAPVKDGPPREIW